GVCRLHPSDRSRCARFAGGGAARPRATLHRFADCRQPERVDPSARAAHGSVFHRRSPEGQESVTLIHFFVTVTVALAVLLGSATDVALTVTVAGFGTELGARYTPDALIVPTVALPPAMPFTFHVTAVFGVFCTSAVNGFVRLTRTVAL